MRRTFLNILTGASVLLGVVVAVLWVRSYRNNSHGDDYTFNTRQGHWQLLSQGGGLTLLERDPFPWFFSGPSTGGKSVPRYNWHDVFGLPYWILLAATVPLPLMIRFIRRRRLRRRATNGLCLRCGYDLRASAERCPECGNEAAAAALATA